MKKIFGFLLFFIIVFAIAAVFNFPYADYVKSKLLNLGTGDMKISWHSSETHFPEVVLGDFTLKNKGDLLLELSSVSLKPTFADGIVFKGSGDNSLSVDGSLKGSDLKADIKNYPLPLVAVEAVGPGVFNLKGSYNLKSGSGNVKYNGVLESLPVSAISGKILVDGEADISKEATDLKFTLKGDGEISSAVKGSGKACIKGNDVSGLITVDTGIIPVNLKIKGTLDDIKLSL